METFTIEETDLLVDDGFIPGYMMDLQEKDLVAIAPFTRTNFTTGEHNPVMTYTVERIMPLDSDYEDYDSNGRVRHTVIVFIGRDLDGRPHHLSYGNTFPCFYKRSQS